MTTTSSSEGGEALLGKAHMLAVARRYADDWRHARSDEGALGEYLAPNVLFHSDGVLWQKVRLLDSLVAGGVLLSP
jgi:hypothetical protein